MENERVFNALLGSLNLSRSGQHQESLRLMDKLIAETIKEGDGLTALILIDHAALLNGGGRDRSLVKHYYEQFLTHNPDNPRVLYESAHVAMEDGQTEIAKQYAKRCHQAILRSDDDKIKKDLLDLVLVRWPELAE
jgi:hypothetical protein